MCTPISPGPVAPARDGQDGVRLMPVEAIPLALLASLYPLSLAMVLLFVEGLAGLL
jgi:hypothetical protein